VPEFRFGATVIIVKPLTAFLLCGSLACRASPAAPSVVEFREGSPTRTITLIGGVCAPSSCEIARLIHNAGNTCATEVHGTATLLDGGGNDLGTFSWALDGNRIVRPLDPVEIRLSVPYEIGRATIRWRISPEWRQVACP
jgi:hypothetical protein